MVKRSYWQVFKWSNIQRGKYPNGQMSSNLRMHEQFQFYNWQTIQGSSFPEPKFLANVRAHCQSFWLKYPFTEKS